MARLSKFDVPFLVVAVVAHTRSRKKTGLRWRAKKNKEKAQQATHTASLHVAWKALHRHVGGCARGAPIGAVDEDLVRRVQCAPAAALGARGVHRHGVAIDR